MHVYNTNVKSYRTDPRLSMLCSIWISASQQYWVDLIEVLDGIHLHTDSVPVFLDLCAAFDTVNHVTLIKTGLDSEKESYLQDRNYFILHNSH